MAARQSPGGIVEPNARRKSWAIRFRAGGRRHTVALGLPEDGWTRAKAEAELRHTLADVEPGIWQPPEATPEPIEPRPEPTFHEFASEWLEAHRDELRDRTVDNYTWALASHLLPYFRDHRLSEITVEEVDRYRAAKVREGRLSANSINGTLVRLAQILEVAVEYGRITSNPARGRRRRLRSTKPQHRWLTPDQVAPLLEAAGEIDAERRKRRRDDPGGRRALLATLTLAGLRIGEATALRWRDVNLASGKLTVGDSKTEAGRRTIDLSPDLRDELAVHRAAAAFADADDLVFSTATGGALNRSNVRSRILLGAVQRANARIAATDSPIEPLPEGISPHGLRHTYASLLFEADNTAI